MWSVTPPVRSALTTTDPEEAHAWLTAAYAAHTPPRLSGDRERFRFEVRSRTTDRFGVDHMAHSMALDTVTEPYRAVYVTQPITGHLRLGTRTTELAAGRGDVMLTGPDDPHQVSWSALGCTVVRLDVPASTHLAAEVAEIDPAAVRFTLSRPLSAARSRHWQVVVRYVTREVLDVAEVAASPLARAEALRLLVTTLTHTFPNGAAEALTDPARAAPGRVEPAALRRAVAFVDDHAGEDIGIADITAAARVGARGLQQAFRRYRDTTPMEYLRRVRLERAHRDLEAADPTAGDTVAAIAARWGFAHHGRFAAHYQRAYGRPPGHTLRL